MQTEQCVCKCICNGLKVMRVYTVVLFINVYF